jgi:hypothetical protein
MHPEDIMRLALTAPDKWVSAYLRQRSMAMADDEFDLSDTVERLECQMYMREKARESKSRPGRGWTPTPLGWRATFDERGPMYDDREYYDDYSDCQDYNEWGWPGQ